MVELNHRERFIKVKVVYYGPPVGGKTTNLQVLHAAANAERRGEMVSVNSAQDRTILFDLLPLRTAAFRGFDLRLQILAVPGQAMYAATRRLVLKGADALVFVANSAADRWDENLQSYREMIQNLLTHHLDPATMPLVFQFNKRDLPTVTDLEIMERALNGRKTDAIPAVALRGEGVLETFSAILNQAIQDLTRRYSILDRKDGRPVWQWTEEAVLGMFGKTTLSGEMSTPDGPQAARVISYSRGVVPEVQLPAPPEERAPTAPPVTTTTPPSPLAALRDPDTPTARFPAVKDRLTPHEDPTAAGMIPEPIPATAEAAPAAPPLADAISPPSHPRWVIMEPAQVLLAAFAEADTPVASVPRPIAPVPGPAPAPIAPPRKPVVAPASPPPPSGRTVVRVQAQAESLGSMPDAEAQAALVESYAEASEHLTTALDELRQERDRAERSLEDLRESLAAARELADGVAMEKAGRRVLARMVAFLGIRHGSLIVPAPGPSHRAVVLHALLRDPLLPYPRALDLVLRSADSERMPLILDGPDSLDLGDALRRVEPGFLAVVAVPFRGSRGTIAAALLYLTPDAVRPDASGLAHLAEMATVVAAPLELMTTLATTRRAERALELALSGSASAQGLEQLVTNLVDLRERLGAIRRRSDAPAWFREEFTEFGPSLGEALAVSRSLLAFSRGQIERGTLPLREVLQDLSAPGVNVTVGPNTGQYLGDASLLRLAFETLVRQAGSGRRGPVEVRAERSKERILVSVGPVSPREGDEGLGSDLVRRIVELHGGEMTTQHVTGEGDWTVLSLL